MFKVEVLAHWMLKYGLQGTTRVVFRSIEETWRFRGNGMSDAKKP